MFVLPRLAQAQGVVVGIMAGISNDLSVEQQNAHLKSIQMPESVLFARASHRMTKELRSQNVFTIRE
jgi:hypothetical protein